MGLPRVSSGCDGDAHFAGRRRGHHLITHGVPPKVREVKLRELVREVVKVSKDLGHVTHTKEGGGARVVAGIATAQPAELEGTLIQAQLPTALVRTHVRHNVHIKVMRGTTNGAGAC